MGIITPIQLGSTLFAGNKVIPIDDFMLPKIETEKQFRFPKSKKRRIRRKFAKDKRNFKPIFSHQAMRSTVDGSFIVPRSIYDKLVSACNQSK